VTTMTTVGYGDEYPETTLGRVYALVLMIVGIGFIAILTARSRNHSAGQKWTCSRVLDSRRRSGRVNHR